MALFRGPTGWRGSTPLIYAIEGRHPEAIRILAAAGADLDRRLPDREPTPSGLPLLWAVEDDLTAELTRAMLESGATPNVILNRGVDGGDPLIAYAAGIRRCESVRLLVEHGAELMITDQRGAYVFGAIVGGCLQHLQELLPLMLARGLNVNAQFGDGQTVLMVVARRSDAHLVRLLLESGADPSLVDRQGRTAVDWAREREDAHRDEVVSMLEAYASDP
jgi:uncharacterized protein